jgi:SAM-dependent methyltransferase
VRRGATAGRVCRDGYATQARERYRLEPYFEKDVGFEETSGLQVLEIGVALGADHQRVAEADAQLSDIDLTERAIEHTSKRLALFGLHSDLRVGDAENLPFQDGQFERVYSLCVLHHSPNTQRAVAEVHRVLQRGGEARVMIYHRFSLVGYMLWLRYALLSGKLWRSLDDIYASHLESPGTKAYSLQQARNLFCDFERTAIETVLTHGDLLTSDAGQRHKGRLLSLARLLWPRWLLRRVLKDHGLFMLIRATK